MSGTAEGKRGRGLLGEVSKLTKSAGKDIKIDSSEKSLVFGGKSG